MIILEKLWLTREKPLFAKCMGIMVSTCVTCVPNMVIEATSVRDCQNASYAA